VLTPASRLGITVSGVEGEADAWLEVRAASEASGLGCFVPLLDPKVLDEVEELSLDLFGRTLSVETVLVEDEAEFKDDLVVEELAADKLLPSVFADDSVAGKLSSTGLVERVPVELIAEPSVEIVPVSVPLSGVVEFTIVLSVLDSVGTGTAVSTSGIEILILSDWSERFSV